MLEGIHFPPADFHSRNSTPAVTRKYLSTNSVASPWTLVPSPLSFSNFLLTYPQVSLRLTHYLYTMMGTSMASLNFNVRLQFPRRLLFLPPRAVILYPRDHQNSYLT